VTQQWTIPQDWGRYSAAEHSMWDQLFARQVSMLATRVAPGFMQGMDVLRMSKPGIPDFDELSERLNQATGWSVVAVPGLIPDDVFFENLANRRFVAGRFIRSPDQMDYLQEPDVFHDVFGHVPLLVHPVFADYMQAYGQGGLRAMRYGSIHRLARLYWYTVEFGLIRGDSGLQLYGAGIVSSNSESLFALDSDSPNRLGFDLKRVMRTKYRIDDFQQNYFVIDSFEQLLTETLETDFGPLYSTLDELPDIEVGSILPTDRIITRGSQAHAGRQAGAAPADLACADCEAGAPCLKSSEIAEWLEKLHEEWRIAEDGKSVHRLFRFADYDHTMSFVNAVAHIADTQNHHPEFAVGYDYCRVTFETHSVGGLSRNDFICASKIDRLAF
jgi:phenylalanine-4-hydroxylase